MTFVAPVSQGNGENVWRAILDYYEEIDVHDSWKRLPGLAALINSGDVEVWESEKYGGDWSLITYKETENG